MKSSDEIKKGLETCSADECHGQHTDCPYHPDLMCIRNICADALALIQQLEAKVHRWISVEEKLPEAHADGSVDAELVTDGEFIHMAYYAHGQWIFCESGEMKEPMWNTVTHWMPLPEPPEEESTC